MSFAHLSRYFLVLIIIAVSLVSHGVEIVRLELQIGASTHEIDIELFDAETPLTVQNFLNYVGSSSINPRYNGSFIHRSVSDFVLQGGGYTYDSAYGAFEYDDVSGLYTGGLQRIQKDPPIVNEFPDSGLSNIRGTVAMAKLSGDPDSATSEWFINMADNSDNLDNQNGGFTVFGQVLDAGMDVIDTIASITVYDRAVDHFAMGQIPLENYINNSPITENNLVMIKSVTSIQRPILKTDIEQIDFGIVAIGDSVSTTVSVTNTGNADLVMDSNSIVALSGPFLILAESCSNKTLIANSNVTCTITLQYNPMAIGIDQARLEIIPANNTKNITLSLDITGEGVPVTPVLFIENNIASIDYGDTALNTVTNQVVVIQNRGGGILAIDSVSINGPDQAIFSVDDGCNSNTILSISEKCTLVISFSPDSEGVKNAVLSITSNSGHLDIDLTGNSEGPEVKLGKTSLDFGFTPVNTPVQRGVGIKNVGIADLEVTSISIHGLDSNSFSQENTCPSVATMPPDSLSEGGLCAVIVTFTPVTDGQKSATLSIVTNDADNKYIDIPLTGAVGESNVSAPQELSLDVAQINGLPSFNQFYIKNTGSAPLEFTSLSITGVDAAAFYVGSDCPGLPIAPGNILPLKTNESCGIAVQFSPTFLGEHNAQLEINTNDPDEPIYIVSLDGIGDIDVDGVGQEIEQNAPNNGDGNNDEIQDDIQNNVVSLISANSTYITIVTPNSAVIKDIGFIENPNPMDTPAGITFIHGLFQYEVVITAPQPTVAVTVAILLPQGDSSLKYYKYGPTTDNPEPHWYDFSYDGVTGAQYLGDVQIEPPGGGQKITRSMFLMNFIDGARGDDDLLVNGVVTDTGGVATVNSSGGGGALSWIMIFIILWRLMRNQHFELN
jgi:cyclophilin family peptidyl-prolyl cis-trans isomerase